MSYFCWLTNVYQPVYLHNTLSHLVFFLSLFLIAVANLLTMEDNIFILGQLFLSSGKLAISEHKTRLFGSLNTFLAVRQMSATSLHKVLGL